MNRLERIAETLLVISEVMNDMPAKDRAAVVRLLNETIEGRSPPPARRPVRSGPAGEKVVVIRSESQRAKVIEALGGRGPMAIEEVATAAGLPPRDIGRTLRALHAAGIIGRVGRGKYMQLEGSPKENEA